jgi:serine/threonine protein kinase
MSFRNILLLMINDYTGAHNKNIMDRKKYCLQDFQLLSVFGYGNYSKVALVRKKDDQKIYAMKVIKKENKVKGVKKSHAFTEKEILTRSCHPFVIKLHATFQDSKRLFFIEDYCPGGELFSLIKRVRRIS